MGKDLEILRWSPERVGVGEGREGTSAEYNVTESTLQSSNFFPGEQILVIWRSAIIVEGLQPDLLEVGNLLLLQSEAAAAAA